MIYEAKLSIPFAWDDEEDLLGMEYIPNGFDKKLYSDGILFYKEEFRSKVEAIDFIKKLLNKFSNLLRNNKKVLINSYEPTKGINYLISYIEKWKNWDNKFYNGNAESFYVCPLDDVSYDPMTGRIEIVEKHFTHNFSLLFTEEEYNLINSDIRFKVTCGEIKEAILNCYRNKGEK